MKFFGGYKSKKFDELIAGQICLYDLSKKMHVAMKVVAGKSVDLLTLGEVGGSLNMSLSRGRQSGYFLDVNEVAELVPQVFEVCLQEPQVGMIIQHEGKWHLVATDGRPTIRPFTIDLSNGSADEQFEYNEAWRTGTWSIRAKTPDGYKSLLNVAPGVRHAYS